jgi:Flavin containing amine oxidoreductase
MGLPSIPLARLYGSDAWKRMPSVSFHQRHTVEGIGTGGFVVNGRTCSADFYICALPFEKLGAVGLPQPKLEHTPITGIHLWFDREVTNLPHATLLDRTIQWMFNKDGGRYLQLVVSASRDLTGLSRGDIIQIALGDLRLYFPRVAEANLVKAHVIKEQRAVFSPAPDTEVLRPGPQTAIANLFLAGDWTQTGWPATMEGAVRSGYIAAEQVARSANSTSKFLIVPTSD